VSDLNDRSKPDETSWQAQQNPHGQQGQGWQQPGQYGQPQQSGQYGQYGAGQQNPYGTADPYAKQNPYAQQNPYAAPQYGAADPYRASTHDPYAPQKTSTLAILSIIFAFGGLVLGPLLILASPAGAILGHVALGRIKQTGEQGRGLALAGIIGGWVLTALFILLVIVVIAVFAAAPGSIGSDWDSSGGGVGALVR
jgi:hypothetical protein